MFTTGILCKLLILYIKMSSFPGITWHTLHVLDYTDYWLAPKLDYVPLPLTARTPATRVRWWQTIGPKNGKRDDSAKKDQLDPFLQNDSPMGWTLEDVYIGGSEINPSQLYETFDKKIDETRCEFYPNGGFYRDVCSRESRLLNWGSEAGIKRITTGQLIVQEGYMIQFKVWTVIAKFYRFWLTAGVQIRVQMHNCCEVK